MQKVRKSPAFVIVPPVLGVIVLIHISGKRPGVPEHSHVHCAFGQGKSDFQRFLSYYLVS